MKKLSVVLASCLVASVAAAQPKKEPAVDYAALAEKVVSKTANVKEGEIVEVVFGPNDIAFAEEIAVALAKRGAHPLLRLHSENLERKLNAGVPEKYDSQPRALGMGLAKLINARIEISPVRDPSIADTLPPARRALQAKRGLPVNEAARKRNVRSIELDNGFAPSAPRAKELGITEAELAKMYWDGIGADYTPVEEKAKAMKALLAKGGELRITHANGTDLKMKIKGRKVLASDGVISDEDKKAGGASVQVWLPAGEVYVTPVPGSTEGKLVDDRFLMDGKEVLGLTLDVKAGKVTNISAKSGWDALKPRYDAAGPGKLEVSVFDVGINPSIKTTAKFESYVSAGMVTIGIGGNVWAGGTNKEPFVMNMFLPGSTVMLDGKPLIEAGVLK
ncbi:MAG: aminopeptidase [Myxococcota bacterium]|nr:aminopeptidase [Myxococcota bacterium]